MEESEEKPPEGYNNNPKPVTPKPGAAQLWLAGLKAMEEGAKKKKNNKYHNKVSYGTAKGIGGVLHTRMSCMNTT